MKTIDLPLQDIEAESIFNKCISNYKDTNKISELSKLSNFIKNDSAKYLDLVPHSFKLFEPAKFSQETTRNLSSVYTDKFAKKGGPGRPYYEEILSKAPNGICPLCGTGIAGTLDHYLPKSTYPTLATTPANLIPSCFDCNHSKGSASEASSLPIHIYLDKIPRGKWLYANFNCNFTIDYRISCPSDWDPDLCRRINNHFNVYSLRKKYAAFASEMLVEKKRNWKSELETLGPKHLSHSMSRELDSFKNIDENSWKSALLECLIKSEYTNMWLISDA